MAAFFSSRIGITTTTTSSKSFKQQLREFSKFSLAKRRGNCSISSFSTASGSASSTATRADAVDLRPGSSVSSAVVKTPPTAWWGPDPDTGMWVPARQGQQSPFTGSVSVVDEQQPWFREDVHLHYHLDHRSA